MALELPSWLVNAFYIIGLPWPGIDEDQLRAWATSARGFADTMTESSARTHQTVATLAGSSDSAFTTALAARWDHHNQLIAELHGPINDFADVLDVAADAVVLQKYACIGAATVLAGEFVATQVGAFFTLGADEAALPLEVAAARWIVKTALEDLAFELMGKLINAGASAISDYVGSFLTSLLSDALPLYLETQSLMISYQAVREAAQAIRGHAAQTEEAGAVAYSQNADRDLEDSDEGGDGDGGQWAAVLQAVEMGLRDVAEDLFGSLPRAIFRDQAETADVLDAFATKMAMTDRDLGGEVPRADDAAMTPAGSGAGDPAQFPVDPDYAAQYQDWEALKPPFKDELAELQRRYPPAPEAPPADMTEDVRARATAAWEQAHGVEQGTITPAMRDIAAEDPARQLVGLDKATKGLDRTLVKAGDILEAKPGLTPEAAVGQVNDVVRYTFMYPEGGYTAGVTADVRRLEAKGFIRVESKNFWPKDQVKGINSTWEDPASGQQFEVQFHTKMSFEGTRLTHPAYEQIRVAATPDEARTEMRAFQARVNAHLPTPPGAREYKDYRRES